MFFKFYIDVSSDIDVVVSDVSMFRCIDVFLSMSHRYLTCMIALFDRLEPRMTEAEELSYAHRNLLPRLQLVIPRGGAVNLTYLEQLAVSAEKTYRVAKAYKPPPTPERSLLPNLAYRKPRGRNRD